MGIDRILARTESDFTERSVAYIEAIIVQHQSTRRGNFILGIAGTNGKVRRSRAADIFACLGARKSIDWRRVCVFLLDERFGFATEPESNVHLVRSSLLNACQEQGTEFPEEHFVTPDTSLPSWEECACDYEEKLRGLFEREVVAGPDLVTFGLGSDGSIASIFPEWYQKHPERWDQVRDRTVRVLCTETSNFEIPKRICVNLRVIRGAQIIIAFLGEGTEEAWVKVKEDFARMRGVDVSQISSGETPVSHGPLASPHFQPPVRARTQSLARAASIDFGAPTDADPPEPLSYIMKYREVCIVQLKKDTENHHAIVVLGAAGDLAKKKTFPSIFQLYLNRVLPTNVSMFGCDNPAYSHINTTDEWWEQRLEEHLQNEGRETDLREFRSQLEYVAIDPTSAEGMRALDQRIKERVKGMRDNRIFYLALPPFLFDKAVSRIREECWTEPGGFVRVVVEKPFGHDLHSARELSQKLAAHLQELHIFRIDHYLAKTMVLNILSMRFANRELGKLFHADNVANVRITFKEDIGVQGRAGYFDGYGIIRDVMQNHLLQLLTLVTMEAPASLKPEDVRDEKVKVLKQIRPVRIEECAVGQYEGYQDDPDIQKVNEKKGYKSRCPTFAVVVLHLDNERWSGVPLILKAGKALERRSTIVRLQFKKAPQGSLFGDQPQNELVIHIQPNESIEYKMLAKTPGLGAQTHEVTRTILNLDVRAVHSGHLPEAYEKLIHDVIQGQSHNFVRSDEVEEGWRIFDPLLRSLEAEDGPVPESYRMGSRGPRGADDLINSTGYRRYTKTGVPGLAGDDFG